MKSVESQFDLEVRQFGLELRQVEWRNGNKLQMFANVHFVILMDFGVETAKWQTKKISTVQNIRWMLSSKYE